MQQSGGSVSKVDPAVFCWLDDSCHVMGVLACHVDDFVWGGSETFSMTVISHLKAAFQVGLEEDKGFSYTGIEALSVEDEIQEQQWMYIKNLQTIHVDPTRATQQDAPLTDTEYDMLKSILATSTKHAAVKTLHCANKLIRELKSDEVTLRFWYLGKDSSLKPMVFSDSSMGNLPDGGTQGGHLIMLMGQIGRFSPICWQSKRIRRVVRSTLAGETLAFGNGINNLPLLPGGSSIFHLWIWDVFGNTRWPRRR